MKTPTTAEIATYAALSPTFNPARNRWELPDLTLPRMIDLFETEEQARRHQHAEADRWGNRLRWEAEQAAAKVKAEAERAAYLASFRGFLPADAMRAGRILQTLERQHLHRGQVRNRKQTVELLVSEGRTLTENGLENAAGYLVLGKTERAYAAHLIALRDAAQPATFAA